MKMCFGVGVLLLCSTLAGTVVSAQQGGGRPPAPQGPPTITSVLDFQLMIVEREFVGAAQAMPEDKYSFAPTNGEFKRRSHFRAGSETCRDSQ